jgi:hypothetical protein
MARSELTDLYASVTLLVKISVGETFYLQFLREAQRHCKIFCFLLLVLLTTSCGQASTKVQKDQAIHVLPTPVPTLRSLAQAQGMYIGTGEHETIGCVGP